MSNLKIRTIAFYLPQFHPIPENDSWWGKGFTEWFNVAKAKPLFRGHIQPKVPTELGFYDLRLSQIQEQQAQLATSYGIHGFCYWHYWFAGKRLLNLPVDNLISNHSPDLPFCLGWANETWTGIWHGAPGKVLIEQTYPADDPQKHYECLRQYFHDKRYIRHDQKPLFYLYKPNNIPNCSEYLASLRKFAKSDGFDDLYIVGTWSPNPRGRFQSLQDLGLDAAVLINLTGRDSIDTAKAFYSAALEKIISSLSVGPMRISYKRAARHMLPPLSSLPFKSYHTVIPNWDNTPRSGRRGLVVTGSSPNSFSSLLSSAYRQAFDSSGGDRYSYVFLKSWNEWAEGNYLEPDIHSGREYLQAVKDAQGPFAHCIE